jgi:hypothetical protein
MMKVIVFVLLFLPLVLPYYESLIWSKERRSKQTMKKPFRAEPMYDEVRMSIPETYRHRQSLFFISFNPKLERSEARDHNKQSNCQLNQWQIKKELNIL